MRPDLQPVQRRPRSLFEQARAAIAQESRDGLLFLHARKRTPRRLLRWLMGDD